MKEYTVSAAEMKEIERQADERGLPYRQMMENAGTAAFEEMRKRWPLARRILIFAGKGNNGGDGFVVARLFASRGKRENSADGDGVSPEVTVVLCEGEPVTEDARYNFRLLEGEEMECVSAADLSGYAEAAERGEAEVPDLIVDALYGTGFRGSLRSNGERAAALMNSYDAPVCALDLPSGMNADSGEAAEGAVEADVTVAFHRKKHGHAVPGAERWCGEIVVADIGIPESEERRL